MTQEPHEVLAQVSSPEDLARFVKVLRKQMIESPEKWESVTLPDYLEAMSAWLEDASDPRSQANAILREGPTWRTFAQILGAASMYE